MRTKTKSNRNRKGGERGSKPRARCAHRGRGEKRMETIQFVCKECGKHNIRDIVTGQTLPVFCNRICDFEYRKNRPKNEARYKVVEFTCRECGHHHVWTIHRSRSTPTYCSQECRLKYTRSHIIPLVPCVCLHCKITFPISSSYPFKNGHGRLFCSKECETAHNRRCLVNRMQARGDVIV
jgi:hypothetical protein